MTTVADLIRHLKPCQDALQWAANYTNPVQAWNECPRGDWMLWLLGKTNHSNPWTDGRKALLACCLDCAETAKHLWPEKQLEVISMSVAVLRCWIAGTASADAAKKARRDLYAAYAYAVAAAYVASAAAAYAAAYAAADAARENNQLQCADIVRRHFPNPPNLS